MKPAMGRPMTSSTKALPPLILAGLRVGKAEELAFAGGHVARSKSIPPPGVPNLVVMEIAVEEHLDARVGPGPQFGGEARPGD